MTETNKVICFSEVRQKAMIEQYHQFVVERNYFGLQTGQTFDSFVEAEQRSMSEEKLRALWRYSQQLKRRGILPGVFYEQATSMSKKEFFMLNQIEWDKVIGIALTYFAVLRTHNKERYESILELHPLFEGFNDKITN